MRQVARVRAAATGIVGKKVARGATFSPTFLCCNRGGGDAKNCEKG